MSADLVLASRWIHPENRRREALRAAHAQDAEALGDLVAHYLKLKSRRGGQVSSATVRSYHLALRDFLAFCGPSDSPRVHLHRADAEHVEQYLLTLTARVKPSSARTYLHGVRALFAALRWAGVVDDNPAREVRAPYDPVPAHARKRAVPTSRVRALLDAPREAHGVGALGARDTAVVLLGATMGLRAAEIVALDVGDVSLKLGALSVRRGKGGKPRELALTESSARVLEVWIRARAVLPFLTETEPLLVSFSHRRLGRRLTTRGLLKIVNGYLARLSLPPDMFGVHTLRRTAGTRLYRATRDLHVVADILGHASVATTAIYAKMEKDIQRAAFEGIDDP